MQRVQWNSEALDMAWDTEPEKLLAVDEAIRRLEAADAVAARLVVLRFFAGLPNDEAAKMLELSPATARRLWTYARAFLHRELAG